MADVPIANPDGTQYTGALIVLLPAETDPVVAASSEPAHLTTIWFGDNAEMQARDTPEHPQIDMDTLQQEVRQYAAELDGPVTVPVKSRGTLGADGADVAFLESTDSLTALREGLLDNEQVGSAHAAVEQYPEWTPHVTLGYPETPARAEYDADSVTFDRIGLWLGGEHFDYPMGGTVSDTITAAAPAPAPVDEPVDNEPVEPDDPEDLIDDEPEDGEELINEIPIHGVLAPEGVETGDGRGFRPGALSTRKLPIPFRTEVVSSHGGNNTSEVVDAGRIDEAWLDEPSQMWRFLGAIVLSSPGGASALEGIVSGVRTGVSIDADQMSEDVETYTDEYIQDALAQGKRPTQWYKSSRVAGLTHVPIPAFEEAYVGLGHEFEEDMTPEDQQSARDALAACGCLEAGVDYADLSADPDEMWRAAAEAEDGNYRDLGTAERKKMADAGTAMPDGSYPIANVDDLRNAIQAIGRAKDPAAVKAHIKKRAKALGEDALIPEGWSIRALGGIIPAGAQHALVGDGPESIIPISVKVPSELIEQITFAPGTHDGPGWITHPVPTARIRRYWTKGKGAAKIGWGTGGDFNRCRAQLAKYVKNPDWLAGMCANMHEEALGFWPSTHRKMLRASLAASGALPAPIMTLVASGGESFRFPAEFFEDPGFTGVTPLTIDKASRRVYGHLAQWKSCHIGISGACERPPHSGSGYANFLKGVIDTDQGEVAVGTLTYGIGHANPMMRAAAATAHYDQTDAVFAFVNVGEDAHGIWYAGVLRASVDDDTVDDIRAIGALSGDWRRFPRYGLDLVAAVSVNTPGYSLAASGAQEWEGHGDLQMSALGLGIVEANVEHGGETHDEFATRLVEMTKASIRRDERRAALSARTKSMRLAEVHRRIERIS